MRDREIEEPRFERELGAAGLLGEPERRGGAHGAAVDRADSRSRERSDGASSDALTIDARSRLITGSSQSAAARR